MVLIDVVKKMKEAGYAKIPTNDLLAVLYDGIKAIGSILVEAGEGAMFQIPRFGTFKVQRMKARISRNPRDGSTIKVPSKLKVKFKPSTILQEGLNKMNRRRPR